MKIQGTFKNINNQIIKIIISDNISDDNNINIDTSDDVKFCDDPISISFDVDTSFDTNISRLCEVRLLTKNYLGNYLFSDNEHDKIINVFVNDICVFAGYVEPNIYSQKYSEVYNELDISCTDYIATLQYNNLLNDGKYEEVIKTASIKTYNEYFESIGLFNNKLNLSNPNYQSNIWYDKSKEITSGKLIFNEASVNELLFLDQDESSVYNNFDLLHELLQYLDLHICQIGYDFYIFSWESIRQHVSINFINVKNNTIKNISINNGNITKDCYSSDSTSISLDDVFNQIQVTCELEETSEIFESPLDSELLESPYNGKQIYTSEIGLSDEYEVPFRSFMNNSGSSYGFVITHEHYFNKDKDFIYDWYMRVLNNNHWKFYKKINNEYKNVYEDLNNLPTDETTGQLCYQHTLAKYLKNNDLTPALFSFGKTNNVIQTAIKRQETEQPSMSPCLVISVNGNGLDDEETYRPNENDLQEFSGCIEYNSNKFVQLSPPDESSVNYIVFSGEVLLQPLQKYSAIQTITQQGTNNFEVNRVEIDKGEMWYDQRYKTQKFVNSEKSNLTSTVNERFIAPPTDMTKKEYEYNTNPLDAPNDFVNRVDVLECELKIGNKYLCEVRKRGNISVYEWHDIDHLPEISYTDKSTGQTVKYKIHTFSLYFDPTIGDFILGQKYPLKNTVKIDMNLEDGATGIAVPITAADNVSGEMTFKILGPVNSMYNHTVRRHPTWFRRTNWETTDVPLLAHIQNIYINKFECKIYTNNGKYENDKDGDLIYMSDEQHKYINKKDDISFNIHTALTPEEAIDLKVKNTIDLSSVYVKDNEGNFKFLRQINDLVKSKKLNEVDHKAKPEELYVESYYTEYKLPRLIIESQFFDNSKNLSKYLPYNTLYVNYYNEYFNVIGSETSLKYCTSNVKLKTCNI